MFTQCLLLIDFQNKKLEPLAQWRMTAICMHTYTFIRVALFACPKCIFLKLSLTHSLSLLWLTALVLFPLVTAKFAVKADAAFLFESALSRAN
jgi:hypothetical protein